MGPLNAIWYRGRAAPCWRALMRGRQEGGVAAGLACCWLQLPPTYCTAVGSPGISPPCHGCQRAGASRTQCILWATACVTQASVNAPCKMACLPCPAHAHLLPPSIPPTPNRGGEPVLPCLLALVLPSCSLCNLAALRVWQGTELASAHCTLPSPA